MGRTARVASACSGTLLRIRGDHLGKLAYLSPEQSRQAAIDRRSDIWTLGVVLWEFLTLTRLFADDDGRQKGAIGHASTINRLVPSELDDAIARALERDVDQRYGTAREMAIDLEEIMAARNEVVTAAAVGDWLQGMFPGELAQRRALLRRAQQISKPPPRPAA